VPIAGELDNEIDMTGWAGIPVVIWRDRRNAPGESSVEAQRQIIVINRYHAELAPAEGDSGERFYGLHPSRWRSSI
jgi:hypothetical protein